MFGYDTQRKVVRELDINSCGCQVVNDKDYSVTRTRIDYTLMYLSEGVATVYIDGKPKTIRAGEALLYLPDVQQRHIYLQKDGCVNKFVHFSGHLCSILDGEPIRIIPVASKNEFESNIDRLIRAYCRIDPQRELLCDGYLRTIIALLKDSEQIAAAPKETLQERIRIVINTINTHINEPINLDDCAKKCFVSRERFNHMFKEQTGYPPLQYINKLRIERAKQLLADAGLSVSECAETLGFTDVNYFSRLFRKFTGVSPSKYK
ncbi:MAG: AraC family transcriptional regulator [Acutalibacteraceae bacterium]|nr:AraC family transcriptional regulator [Acutalibacteraceae bacterium]